MFFVETILDYLLLEIAVLSLVAFGFMLRRVRSFKALVEVLDDRIKQLFDVRRKEQMLSDEKISKLSYLSEQVKDYSYYLKEQVDVTQKYHKNLGSTQSIKDDLSIKADAACRVAALRNYFLLAEYKALQQLQEEPNWMVLGKQLDSLVLYYIKVGKEDSVEVDISKDIGFLGLEALKEGNKAQIVDIRSLTQRLDKITTAETFLDMLSEIKQAFGEQASKLLASQQQTESVEVEYRRCFNEMMEAKRKLNELEGEYQKEVNRCREMEGVIATLQMENERLH